MNTKKSFEVPILIIAFKRAKTLEKVIHSIKNIKPKTVFIACDGPSKNNPLEVEKVKETRDLIKRSINWECNLKLRYSDVNQGCKLGATNAVSWFFENIEEGIILEDDTVPHKDFFYFCQNLLEKYRYDERIWSITGTNFMESVSKSKYGYFFGRYPALWGWASWRRVWNKYDVNISFWPEISSNKITKDLFNDDLEREYWESVWDEIYYKNKPDTWCYQWTLCSLINNGLNIYPKVNLIKNIGFGEDATHTLLDKEPIPFGKGLKNIKHPTFTVINQKADKYYINESLNLKKYRFFGGKYFMKFSRNIFILNLKLYLIKIKNNFKKNLI